MQAIYETTIRADVTDYASESEAREAVEAAGEGRVVTFIRDYDGRERSCAMSVFRDGAWRGVNIHE